MACGAPEELRQVRPDGPLPNSGVAEKEHHAGFTALV